MNIRSSLGLDYLVPLAAKSSSFGCQEVKKKTQPNSITSLAEKTVDVLQTFAMIEIYIPIQVHISLVSLKSPPRLFVKLQSY